jgi:trigger factor
MTVEVAEERIETQMRQTARRLARNYNFPGFRKGKVPYQVLLTRLGHDYLRTEAIEDLLQPIFEEAMEEVDPEIYAQAQFMDMELSPLVLKFTIPLAPEVKLGDYRSVRREIEPVMVTDEAVADALDKLRQRYQEQEPVDRPVAAGDLVTLSGKGVVVAVPVPEPAEGEEAAAELEEIVLFDTQHIELAMDDRELFPGTTFVENLLDLSAGDSKSFSLIFPDDFEEQEFAGREARFDVEILNVQNRLLPELDDALAEREGLENLAALEAITRENLEKAAKSQQQNDLIEEMIDRLLETATLVYPPAAVDMEVDSRIETFKNQVSRSGWEWEDYLKLQGMEEGSLRGEFREGAEEALRRQLVLRQFVLDEKLKVGMDDLDAKLDERLAVFGDNPELAEGMRNYYKSGYGFEMISSEILVDKAHERVVAIFSGTAPDLADLTDEETAVAEDESPVEEAETEGEAVLAEESEENEAEE